MIVGDKGFKDITITEDNMMQDYRVFIDRAESKQQGISNGNQLLFTLLQAGMIDQEIFSNLFNRANPDLIAQSIRQYNRDKMQAENMAAKQQGDMAAQMQMQQSDAQAQMMQMAQGQQQQQMDQQTIKHDQEMEKIAYKEGAKTERDMLKNQGMQ
jgi:hypothetical protein